MTAPLVVTVIGSAVPATAAAMLIVLPATTLTILPATTLIILPATTLIILPATTLVIPPAIAPIVPLAVSPIVVPTIVTRVVPRHLVTLVVPGRLIARLVPGNRVTPDISRKSVSILLEPVVVATALEQPELDQIGADSIEVVAVVIGIEVDDHQTAVPLELPPPIVPTVVPRLNPFDPTKPPTAISASVAEGDPAGDGTASDTYVSPDPLGFNLLDRQERQQQCGSEYQVPGIHSVLHDELDRLPRLPKASTVPIRKSLCHNANTLASLPGCPRNRTPGRPVRTSEDGATIFGPPHLIRPGGCVANGFKVSVSKDYLVFSAAHFITLAGHQCESLHGHNYRIGVTVEGGVDPECAFVVDFAVLKRLVRPYVQAVDHRVLLPTLNPKLHLTTEGDRLVVDYLGARRFMFPVSNCAMIPITNTTAEMIAEYLAHRLRDDLRAEGLSRLDAIELEVEESAGQAGYYRLGMSE